MRTRLLVLTLTAAAIALAGCGGSSHNVASTDSGSSGTATTATAANAGAPAGGSGKALSATLLVGRADTICKRLNTKLATNEVQIHSSLDVVRAAPRRAELEQAAAIELSRLVPPASLASVYGQLVSDMRVVAEDTSKIGQDAAANDVRAEQPLFVAGAEAARGMIAIAKRTGFKHCTLIG